MRAPPKPTLADQLRAQSTALDRLIYEAELPPSHGQTERLLDGARRLEHAFGKICRG